MSHCISISSKTLLAKIRSIPRNKLLAPLLLAPLTLLLLAIALLSLQWRMMGDAPLMAYLAFLIDRFHFVPYRDFFDMNVAGTYLFNLLIGKLLGYSEQSFRIADLVYLGSIMTVTWLWMKQLGRLAAWGGIVFFGLFYFEYGEFMSLQREYLMLLPVSAALLVCTAVQWDLRTRSFAIGLLYGFAITIKPTIAIGYPVLLLFLLWEAPTRSGGLRSSARWLLAHVGISLLGLSIPAGALLLYLWSVGALPAFMDLVLQYWPIYNSLTRYHNTLTGPESARYLWTEYLSLGGHALWVLPAAAGAYLGLARFRGAPPPRRTVLLLSGLAAVYSFYPIITAKFFFYHWLPFQFFVAQLSGLCLLEWREAPRPWLRLLPIALLVCVLAFSTQIPPTFLDQVRGRGPRSPSNGKVDQIARYLRKHLRPGDTVQPFDSTFGVLHALLLARGEIAKPFIYDFHFYQEPMNDYIRGIRARLLDRLATAKPRYFIRRIYGARLEKFYAPRKFEELEVVLATDYVVRVKGRGFIIYERRE